MVCWPLPHFATIVLESFPHPGPRSMCWKGQLPLKGGSDRLGQKLGYPGGAQLGAKPSADSGNEAALHVDCAALQTIA